MPWDDYEIVSRNFDALDDPREIPIPFHEDYYGSWYDWEEWDHLSPSERERREQIWEDDAYTSRYWF